MDKQEVKKRVEKLKKEINYYRYLYHALDKQDISDAVLDSLKNELARLEREFPEFITADSPTQRVGGKPLDKFHKVKHRTPMLSLNDAFSQEETREWEERISKITKYFGGEIKKYGYFAELKIDGFAIELVYDNGVLKSGSTRGDGLVGEDVTQNIKTIEAIPLRLNFDSKFSRQFPPSFLAERAGRAISNFPAQGGPALGGQFPKRIEIRGEVFMTNQAFKKANNEQKKKGLPIYANSRNLAAGSIRQLNPRIAASRDLTFLAYDIVTDYGQALHSEEHRFLRELGFRTDEHSKICENLQGVFDFWEYVRKIRRQLPYQIDGIVVTVNSNSLFEELGVVGKAPRGAIAFKFPADQAATVVEDIKVQVGRTGALTPVARLRPIDIGGTTVSRATLHNEDEIRKKDVRIGDTVIVERAGDVIPEVVRVLPRLRPKGAKKFAMPGNCPICGSPAGRQPGEVIYYCSNKRCFAQEKRLIIHFVSKKSFNIDGLGEKIVAQLINEGLIADPADIFKLTEGDLVLLERFAEKSASNLAGAIKKSREIALVKFLVALGIHHVGEETARYLVDIMRSRVRVPIKTPDDLLSAANTMTIENWLSVKDIGPISARSISDWFKDKKNRALLNKLAKLGIIIKSHSGGGRTNKKWSGKTFVLTGELKSFTRDRAKELIRSLGGEVSESISKNIDFLVAGENPGSKYEKAKKLNIKIIKEDEFKKIAI